ncbi:MAG: hypothetical protein Q9214_000623 [Letrouitia sp. 1 TL-2023]
MDARGCASSRVLRPSPFHLGQQRQHLTLLSIWPSWLNHNVDYAPHSIVSADECFECGDFWKPANQWASRTPSLGKRSRKDAGVDECDGGIDQLAAKCARHESQLEEGAGTVARVISKPVVTAKHFSNPLSKRAKHQETLRALYESSLKAERARSDPEDHWKKYMKEKQQWLDEVFKNGDAINAKEMPRFMRA